MSDWAIGDGVFWLFNEPENSVPSGFPVAFWENSMLTTILDNIIIIILTVFGITKNQSPALLIISAAALMILITYRSFCDEPSKAIIVINLFLMILFAFLSVNVSGFLVIFLQKDIRKLTKIIVGTVLFVISYLIINENGSIAMCILHTLILLALYTLLTLIQKMIEWIDNRKINENQRIVQSNISELHEKRLNEQLVMQKLTDEKNARLRERENISRNIHNSVGHSITAAIMTLDAADMLYDVKPEEARKKMNDANTRIRGSLESIRRAVRVLDEENKILLAKDLKEELRTIAAEFAMDTSIEIFENYNEIADEVELPDEHVVFLTGVLQESLTNGLKHGNATEFVVFLMGDTAHVRLEISDNGASDFDKTNQAAKIEQGFGLKKIDSYVKMSGGKTKFTNDGGFKTIIELPILGG